MLKRTIGMGGFTLAEVLITLGIIGVVAAMTMPTLINSTQGAQYKTAYKKALSVMSQAVVMNIALEDYDLSQTVAGTNGNEAAHGDVAADNEAGTPARNAETQTIYTLFKNRMNVVKVSGKTDLAATYKVIDAGDSTDIPATTHFGGKDSAGTAGTGKWTALTTTAMPDWTYMFFNDGIVFMFDNTQGNCHAATNVQGDAYCSGWIDVNGEKGPNKVVRCDTGSIKSAGTDEATCTVTNPTDLYPIMFYDQTIVPASAAARAVLYAK